MPMSTKYKGADVSIKCRLRISCQGSEYGDTQEMVCFMYENHSKKNQKEWNILDDMNSVVSTEGTFINGRNSGSISHESPTASDRPKLVFESVLKPPSRTRTGTRGFHNFEHIRDQRRKRSDGASREMLPGDIHVRKQSPHPRQGVSRKQRLHNNSPASNRAAALFEVNRTTKAESFDDVNSFEIQLADIVSVDVMEQTQEEQQQQQNDICCISIKGKDGNDLQIFFYKWHEQEVLLAFLRGSLSRRKINIRTPRGNNDFSLMATQQCSSSDMQNFEAQAVNYRFKNESVWETVKRRSARLLDRAEEFCFCGELPSDYYPTSCVCSDNMTYQPYQQTSNASVMEVDDGSTLRSSYSDFDEYIGSLSKSFENQQLFLVIDKEGMVPHNPHPVNRHEETKTENPHDANGNEEMKTPMASNKYGRESPFHERMQLQYNISSMKSDDPPCLENEHVLTSLPKCPTDASGLELEGAQDTGLPLSYSGVTNSRISYSQDDNRDDLLI